MDEVMFSPNDEISDAAGRMLLIFPDCHVATICAPADHVWTIRESGSGLSDSLNASCEMI